MSGGGCGGLCPRCPLIIAQKINANKCSIGLFADLAKTSDWGGGVCGGAEGAQGRRRKEHQEKSEKFFPPAALFQKENLPKNEKSKAD